MCRKEEKMRQLEKQIKKWVNLDSGRLYGEAKNEDLLGQPGDSVV